MQFSLNLRAEVRKQIKDLAQEMAAQQSASAISEDEARRVLAGIQAFKHSTCSPTLTVTGVDGSGTLTAAGRMASDQTC